jgi:hypothetical protein
MVEIGIAQLLAETTAVTDLLGTRIYPVTLPVDALVLPALTYQVVGGSPEYAFDGSVVGIKRIQMDCWSNRYLDGKNAQLAIMQALIPFTGVLPNAYIVLSISQGAELDDFESDSRIYRYMVEFLVEFSF